MLRHMNICLLGILLSLLVFAGCSSDQEATLLGPSQSMDSTDLYANINSVMQAHGVQVPADQTGDKMTPLPSPLLFATMAAAARDAVISGTYWDELTKFVVGNKKYIGYEISWLIDIPEEPDPNAFYCYYFMDIPVDHPRRSEEVDPFTDAIDGTIDRVGDILVNHPELATDRVSFSDDTWLYYHEFKYPVGDSYNVFRMFLVRLYIN